MKKECVFKMFAKGEWWYVYAVQLSEVNLTWVYRVYRGRKWLNRIAFYKARPAIETCIGIVFGCVVNFPNDDVL